LGVLLSGGGCPRLPKGLGQRMFALYCNNFGDITLFPTLFPSSETVINKRISHGWTKIMKGTECVRVSLVCQVGQARPLDEAYCSSSIVYTICVSSIALSLCSLFSLLDWQYNSESTLSHQILLRIHPASILSPHQLMPVSLPPLAQTTCNEDVFSVTTWSVSSPISSST